MTGRASPPLPRGEVAPAATATWRRAAAHSICRAPGCIETIRPGNPISRLPGVGWVHAGCANAAAAADTTRSDQ